MILSYDGHTGIVYILMAEAVSIRKTVEFDPYTIIELGANGQAVGIEMIKPSTAILNRIAKKYDRWELGRVHLDKLLKSLGPARKMPGFKAAVKEAVAYARSLKGEDETYPV